MTKLLRFIYHFHILPEQNP